MGKEKKALSGIRVLDMGSWVAGPAAATVMGDFGADVIKLEAPGVGDPYRFLIEFPGAPSGDDPYTWALTGRNKRSIQIDMKTESGYQAFLDLFKSVDVAVTNFPPNVLRRMKTSYQDLKSHHPKVIYAQMSGYGEEGPEADTPAFDRTAWWARSGMMDAVRYQNTAPTPGIWGWGDHATAMALYGAIMTALFQKERTGDGCKVSTSLLANGLWSNSIPLQAQLGGGDVGATEPRLSAWGHLSIPYCCKGDQWFYPWKLDPEIGWHSFLRVAGLSALIDDPRFAEETARNKNFAELAGLLDEAFGKKTWAEWKPIFDSEEIGTMAINTAAEVLKDPQVLANDMLVDIPDSPFIATQTVTSPISIEGQEKMPAKAAPDQGRHTEEILREIGYSNSQIDQLRSDGGIA